MCILFQPIIDRSGPSIDFKAFVKDGQKFNPSFKATGDVGIRGSGSDARVSRDSVVSLFVKRPAGDCILRNHQRNIGSGMLDEPSFFKIGFQDARLRFRYDF